MMEFLASPMFVNSTAVNPGQIEFRSVSGRMPDHQSTRAGGAFGNSSHDAGATTTEDGHTGFGEKPTDLFGALRVLSCAIAWTADSDLHFWQLPLHM